MPRILIALLLCLDILGATAAAQEDTAAEAVTIGFIGGFTGPGKVFGQACQNGFELGRASAGAPRLKVIYEDDQFLPAKTAAAFKKLVEVDRVAVVIVLGSSPANAVAPLAEQRKIALLAWASDDPVAAGRRYVVRTWVSGDSEGERMAREAVKRGYEQVGFIIATDDYARSVRAGFIKHFPHRLLLEEEYAPDAYDFHPVLLKAKAAGVRQLALSLHPGQSAAVARQAQELGLSLSFFGDENLHRREEAESAKGALSGAWFVTGDVAEDFRMRYLAAFGHDDVISGAALHFELARLLSRLTPGATPEAVIEQLMAGRPQQGALAQYQFVRHGGDQYLSLALGIKEITSTGFAAAAD